jgi:hypothetical protein
MLAAASALASTPATDSEKSASEAYLDALQGHWIMSGTVRNRAVRYEASGQRVLQGGFLRLHLIDAGSPAQYEADVYIGFDPKAREYVAHWLDRFGAAGARVVGRGERQGERLTVTFPYADGDFRDTFIRQAASDSWSVLLESQSTDGKWATFASYALTRDAGP